MKKRSLQEITYAAFLLVAIILAFLGFTARNSSRTEEQNREYASDSAHMKSQQINAELNNALSRINTYAYFLGEGLTEPVITSQMIEKMEENSQFDAVIYTDINGIDYASDGRTADVKNRFFFLDGISGNSGIDIIFDPHFFDETMACFYAPVYYEGEIIGILRGAFLAEEYLKSMLSITYFGEEAQAFLCSPDGRMIASSNGVVYDEHILDALTAAGVIDRNAAEKGKRIFEEGGSDTFACDSAVLTDNICVAYLPENDYVFVQTFPKNVTQRMITEQNNIGIQLELVLIVLFISYIIFIIIRAGRRRKELEKENREMGYIISGVNTLFSRFTMVDFEEDTYQYLAGTKPENGEIPVSGNYSDIVEYLVSATEESQRQELADFMDEDTLLAAMAEHNDLRYERHMIKNGQSEWEHLNVVCVERKDNKVSKILFIRQNVTELKEKELRVQKEKALADRKERQYQIAIMSSSFCSFEFNLTKDLIEQDIVKSIDGGTISFLAHVGLSAPCRASEFFEKWKLLVLEESRKAYSETVNLENLARSFEQGNSEVTAEYWSAVDEDEQLCIRQSFVMTRDAITDDIMVMVISKDITEAVLKQREQTQALEDALIQAQHASKAKST